MTVMKETKNKERAVKVMWRPVTCAVPFGAKGLYQSWKTPRFSYTLSGHSSGKYFDPCRVKFLTPQFAMSSTNIFPSATSLFVARLTRLFCQRRALILFFSCTAHLIFLNLFLWRFLTLNVDISHSIWILTATCNKAAFAAVSAASDAH
jgi:hypothetical protein